MLLLNKYFTFCASFLPHTKFGVFPSLWDFKEMSHWLIHGCGNTDGASVPGVLYISVLYMQQLKTGRTDRNSISAEPLPTQVTMRPYRGALRLTS